MVGEWRKQETVDRPLQSSNKRGFRCLFSTDAIQRVRCQSRRYALPMQEEETIKDNTVSVEWRSSLDPASPVELHGVKRQLVFPGWSQNWERVLESTEIGLALDVSAQRSNENGVRWRWICFHHVTKSRGSGSPFQRASISQEGLPCLSWS